MWAAQRFHGMAPGRQTGSLSVDDYRNARLPLPAKPGVGGIGGPAGFGNGDPHFTVIDPRIPNGGGGGVLLGNPGGIGGWMKDTWDKLTGGGGDGENSLKPVGLAASEDPAVYEDAVGAPGAFSREPRKPSPSGGSGGGGNGNTSPDADELLDRMGYLLAFGLAGPFGLLGYAVADQVPKGVNWLATQGRQFFTEVMDSSWGKAAGIAGFVVGGALLLAGGAPILTALGAAAGIGFLAKLLGGAFDVASGGAGSNWLSSVMGPQNLHWLDKGEMAYNLVGAVADAALLGGWALSRYAPGALNWLKTAFTRGGIRANVLVEGFTMPLRGRGIYAEALKGGRHADLIGRHMDSKISSVNRALRSHNKNIGKHIVKLFHPISSLTDTSNAGRITNEMKHWASEITGWREQSEVLKQILKIRSKK